MDGFGCVSRACPPLFCCLHVRHMLASILLDHQWFNSIYSLGSLITFPSRLLRFVLRSCYLSRVYLPHIFMSAQCYATYHKCLYFALCIMMLPPLAGVYAVCRMVLPTVQAIRHELYSSPCTVPKTEGNLGSATILQTAVNWHF